MKTIALLAALLFVLAAPARALDLTKLEAVPIQEGGRKKPFLVFAEESLLGMAGKARYKKNDEKIPALNVVTSLWLSPMGWENEPLLLIGNKKFKEAIGVDPAKKLFSYRELAANAALRASLENVSAIRAKNPKTQLDTLEREASNIGMRLALFEGIASGNLVTLLPTGAAAWTPLVKNDPALAKLREGFS
jgi:hypothetical protein